LTMMIPPKLNGLLTVEREKLMNLKSLRTQISLKETSILILDYTKNI
jgi:hypothetical protein